MRRWLAKRAPRAGGFVLCLLLIGCDGGELQLPKAFTVTPPAAAGRPRATPSPATAAPADLVLEFGHRLNVRSFFATFGRQSAGRPHFLQVTSYEKPSAESFPSLVIRARCDVIDEASLPAQTLSAEVYLQESRGNAVWTTAPDRPAEVVVKRIDPQQVLFDLEGVLVNVITAETRPVRGAVRADRQSIMP